jgi:Tfp pilus assembly PilM family ATPase
MKTLSQKMSSLLAFFPVPKYLSIESVGIDISPKAIRMMQLRHTKKGALPVHFDEILLDDICGVLENNNDVEKCDELRKALNILKQKYHFTHANISLPELKTYIFKTSIPKEAVGSIDDALIENIQENVPLDPSQIVYDFMIVRKEVYGSDIDVVVTVFPRNVIAAYTKLCEEVGIIPTAFESESQSIARAVIHPQDDTPYLLMNLGYTRANLAIVEQGVVSYTSSLSYDVDALLKDQNGFEAQQLKRKINQLLVYWFTNKRDADRDSEKITTAILTGPHAGNQGLKMFLETSAHITVRSANVWENCFDLNDFVPQITKDVSLKFGTSIGLALLQH